MWFVYVVRCSDRSLYTGITTDAERRVAQHNDGTGARYTRSRAPVELVYLEKVEDLGAALRREHEIKRLNSAGKEALVAEAKPGKPRKRASRRAATSNRRPSAGPR